MQLDMQKSMFVYFFLALIVSVSVFYPQAIFALDFNINRINIVATPTPTSIPTLIPSSSFQRINTDELITTPTAVPQNPVRNFEENQRITPVATRESPEKDSLSAIISAPSSLGVITGSETATREGKLVDIYAVQEKLKLFGFITITGPVNFEIDQESRKIRRIHRPWWSFLAVKPDWGAFFQKAGPNLSISDVAWDKKSYHAGDMAKIHFKIKNTGANYLLDHFDVVLRKGEQALEYKKDFYVSLAPGESVDFLNFEPWPYECDKIIFLEIDETNRIKETEKKDNQWQGITKCAPTTGPDLTVNQLVLNNSFFPSAEKRIGTKNTVKYKIQNIGSETSVKTRALMKTTGGQYLALVEIPPLIPFTGQITGEIHYTPNGCSPIKLDIDTENKNTEINEDNNSAAEPSEITDHCKKGPDLYFGLHYYTLKDGSGAKPHQNGEPLLFQVELLNSATDQMWGCALNVKLAVYENDKLFTTFNEGNFGFGSNCPSGGGVSGTYDHPTTTKTQKFYYPTKCGAKLNFVIDPDITFSDIDRSDNTWSQLIECQ